MGETPEGNRPKHMPRNLRWRGSEWYFAGISRITHDSFYERQDDKGFVHRMIVTNPTAHERQVNYLASH